MFMTMVAAGRPSTTSICLRRSRLSTTVSPANPIWVQSQT
jgi:hypothetical protein